MPAITPPSPIQIDALCDILFKAARHEHVDHGSTRLHFGEHADGKPFVFLQNSNDGIGFELPAV